jgi:hypothetical protein
MKRYLAPCRSAPPLDRRKLLPLVEGTSWNNMIELNRMAFSDRLPRNSESRALGVAFRMIRKNAPHVQWIVSFADAAQCGDGAIYRAAGFSLTGIKRNDQIWAAPDGATFARMSLTDVRRHNERDRATRVISRVSMIKSKHVCSGTGAASMKQFADAGFKPIPGFQLRYIYFLDPTARERLTVPILPFSKIQELGAGMYRGKPRVDLGSRGEPPSSSGVQTDLNAPI